MKRNIKAVELKFEVPMFIGKKDCHYQDYGSYIRKMHAHVESQTEKLVDHYEMIQHQ